MDGWGHVIAAVVDRRAELGWTQKDLAAEAGVSERTIQNLEAGTRPQAKTRHRIERALGWGNGEMRRIEADAQPQRPLVPPDVLAALERAYRDDPELLRAAIEAQEAIARKGRERRGARGEAPSPGERHAG
jgi:transcriptional regulator with XRE-family HTH domain